jgi:hypothetical protein
MRVMGSSGTGLFADDTAMDVRSTYREVLEDGGTDEEAQQAVLDEFNEALYDIEEGPVIWLALAYTQSKLGRLNRKVRDRALAVIASGQDLERWKDVGERAVRQRAAVLDKIRRQLEGPQPSRKRIRRPTRPTTALTPGQVLGYRARSGRWHLMRVVSLVDTRYYLAPIIRFLDYADPALPSQAQLEAIPDRKPHPVRWPKVEQEVIDSGRESLAAHGIRVIGTVDSPVQENLPPLDSSSGWAWITGYLEARDRAMDSADY